MELRSSMVGGPVSSSSDSSKLLFPLSHLLTMCCAQWWNFWYHSNGNFTMENSQTMWTEWGWGGKVLKTCTILYNPYIVKWFKRGEEAWKKAKFLKCSLWMLPSCSSPWLSKDLKTMSSSLFFSSVVKLSLEGAILQYRRKIFKTLF